MKFGSAVVLASNIPQIGGTIAFAVAAIVPAMAALPVAMIATAFDEDSFAATALIFVAAEIFLVAGVYWLAFLREEQEVVICLPIPLVSIPASWLVVPAAVVFPILLIVGGIASLFGPA